MEQNSIDSESATTGADWPLLGPDDTHTQGRIKTAREIEREDEEMLRRRQMSTLKYQLLVDLAIIAVFATVAYSPNGWSVAMGVAAWLFIRIQSIRASSTVD